MPRATPKGAGSASSNAKERSNTIAVTKATLLVHVVIGCCRWLVAAVARLWRAAGGV